MVQAIIDANSIIISVTLFILYGIFLFYDFFRKEGKYGYLAYIIAIIPFSHLWFLSSSNPSDAFNVLVPYIILFLLWMACLIRDFIFVYRKDKDYDDILLFFGLGVLVLLIITAILPSDQLNPEMQANCVFLGYFWFPDLYTEAGAVEAWINPSVLTAFRIIATLTIILVLLPMILDLKDSQEETPLPVLIIITAIFIGPFIYLSYLWLASSIFVLTLLFSVILFIILLMLTKDNK